MLIQVTKIKSERNPTINYNKLLETLSLVTNSVIEDGSGIGWTKRFDDPIQELMPYWETQANDPNVDLIVAYLMENGIPHALGSIQLHTHRGNPRSMAIRHRGELACFFCHPSYRGKGVGYQLICAAEQAARDYGLRKITLDCRSTQIDAIKLYERCGYTRWGTMNNYASLDGIEFYDGYFYGKDLN